MKVLKKWLSPVLTCLIVVGAAVLPPYLSQMRDARQFGQVHAEELAVDALPAYEPPSLTDRIALYANQGSEEHPILSYSTSVYYDDPLREEQLQSARETLVEAGLVPGRFFSEEPFEDFSTLIASRILLWDPADNTVRQAPSSFLGILGEYHSKDGAHYKNFQLRVDEQSGLPIALHVLDTNMARWLPYERDAVQDLAKRYFALLKLDVQPAEPLYPDADTISLSFSVVGTELYYSIEHAGTLLSIRPQMGLTAASSAEGFDG